MSRTLVSFLGRFQRTAGGGGYQRVAYRFADSDRLIETEFFGHAAWKHLRHSADPVEKWVILGTPTSSWDCLFALFDELPEGIEAWLDQATGEIARGGIADETLRAFEAFASYLGVPDLKLRTMPLASDGAFVVLHDVLNEGARVVLDITHGLRALPALALLALGSLRWIKGVRLDDVLYGNFEGTMGGQPKDVVSLLGAARLAELAPSFARIALVDDFEEAENVCAALDIGVKEDWLELRRQAILTTMLYPKEAVDQAKGLWKRLGRWPTAGVSMASVIGAWIRQRATEAIGGGARIPLEERLLRQAEKFLDRRDYLRCMLPLNEANKIVLADQLGVGSDFGEIRSALEKQMTAVWIVEDLTTLNQLRNHTAHGANDSLGNAAAAILREPERIRRFLKTMLSRARQALAGTPYKDIRP